MIDFNKALTPRRRPALQTAVALSCAFVLGACGELNFMAQDESTSAQIPIQESQESADQPRVRSGEITHLSGPHLDSREQVIEMDVADASMVSGMALPAVPVEQAAGRSVGATARTSSLRQAVPQPLSLIQGRSVPAGDIAVPAISVEPADPHVIQRRPDRDSSREEYNPIQENDFLSVEDEPLSTFSIDVDAASYSNMRRFINSGQIPPRDAVRIEELINYFNYDYPDPTGETPFAVVTEISAAPWNPEHHLVHIGLQGKRLATEELPPNNLVFLLDVSGSMNDPSKLPLLQSAFRLLVDELDEEDRVSIVVYAGAAGVVLEPTSGRNKPQILEAINRLQAGGSTAGGAGIERAYELARQNFLENGNNRVILATDGDFNVGVASEGELVRLIEEKREDDIFLTVLGFGTGNLQDAKMEQLANHGNGNYAYIDSLQEARKVMVSELGATLFSIAKDVKLQIEFNPAQVQGYRLIGYENRVLENYEFNDDTKDAGELGAGHSVTALYEIIPVGAETDVDLPTVDPLRYQQPGTPEEEIDPQEMMWVKLRYKEPTADVSQKLEHPVMNWVLDPRETTHDFRFSAAVAGFGMMLRDSQYKGSTDLDLVLDLAAGSRGEDRGGYRREFVDLVRQYGEINGN